MAIDILGATFPVPFIFIIVAVIVFIVGGFVTLLIVMFGMQIPNVFSQITCQMKRRAAVLMHHVNRRAELYAPKRDGKDGQKNTLTLPKALGAKFDPSGEGMEELWGKSIIYHFFSKTSYPIKPADAKAVQDFYEFLGEKGIRPNKALIDFLLVENMDSLDIYTEPLQQWVVKNLPLPINTVKEYLLDKKVIDADYNKCTATIKALEKEIKNLQSYEELTITQEDHFNEFNTQLEEQYQALQDIKTRYAEYDRLQDYKKELADTINEIEELHKHKRSVIEEIDIMTGYLDPDTRETVYTLRRLRDDLKKKVISEGLFVFLKVQELIFAASSLNSAGMNEAVSIANADAYMQNAQEQGGWTMANVGALAVVLIMCLAGAGIAAKIAFG